MGDLIGVVVAVASFSACWLPLPPSACCFVDDDDDVSSAVILYLTMQIVVCCPQCSLTEEINGAIPYMVVVLVEDDENKCHQINRTARQSFEIFDWIFADLSKRFVCLP